MSSSGSTEGKDQDPGQLPFRNMAIFGHGTEQSLLCLAADAELDGEAAGISEGATVLGP